MVIPSWCSFKAKTMNTLLSLDEDGTAPISDLKLVGLRIALMVKDMAENLQHLW